MSIEQGHLTPSLQNKPDLGDAEMLYWEGFWMLSSSRDYSKRYSKDKEFIVMLPLKLAEIVACCALFNLRDMAQRLRFTRVIRHMDSAWCYQLNPKVT